MVIFVTVLFLLVLMSLTIYLHLAGAFKTSYQRAFQLAFYVISFFLALTMGIGIFHDLPVSLSDYLPFGFAYGQL